MKTVIYYFSATGNALVLARHLQARLPDTEIRPITAGDAADLKDIDNLGLVFPTYAYGPPRIVEEFIRGLHPSEIGYTFAVATCAGIPAGVLRRISRLLRRRNIRLNAGFTVRDPSSSLAQDGDRDAVQRLMIGVNRGENPRPSDERLDEIAAAVKRRSAHGIEAGNMKTRILGGLFNALARRAFPQAAMDFHLDGECSGCGRCVAICPRGIIRLEGGRPVWNGACEFCHACIQWCPAEAIEYGRVSRGKRRYRNPAVEPEDLIVREKRNRVRRG